VNDKHLFNLIPPIGNDFCNTDILLDDNISVSSNVTFDTQDNVTKLRPPLELPSPELPPTYENFANTMASIRSKYGTCIFNWLNILNDIDYCHKNFTHNRGDCDYYVEVNTMLSKVSPTTNDHEYDDVIFPPTINTPLPNFQPLIQTQSLFLDTLNNMDTVSIINLFNERISKRKLFCSDTLFQIDGGANRSVTNDLNNLDAYWEIDPISIQGISKNITIQCTHRGVYYLVTNEGTYIPVIMFYSPQSSHTIISPNDIVKMSGTFTNWTQHADFEFGTGQIKFSLSSGIVTEIINLHLNNNLWFVNTPRCNQHYPQSSMENVINSITNDLSYKLWYHCLAHSGQKSMSNLHKVCDGIPKLHRHPFLSKLTKSIKNTSSKPNKSKPGLLFQIDFGFVQGRLHKTDEYEDTNP